MIKFHKIFLVVALGFLLVPSITFACGTNPEKSCCDKEMSSSKTGKMDCCKKDNHSKSKDNNDSCGGKSKHSTCSCSIFHISVVLPVKTEAKIQCFNFFDKKDKFNEKETYLSSGFYSIWLIPKIS